MTFKLWAHLSYFLKDFFFYLVLISIVCLICLSAFYKVFRSKISEHKKKIYLSIIFIFLIIILTYSFFEAYFRYQYDQSDGLGFLKVNQKWHERHVVYNSYFFRDRDFNPVKKEGVTRIGVLGDSIAFGGDIENVEDRFSNILEKNLKSAGYNVEVYNLGTPGYDTEGEIQVYEKVKDLNFDIIIWEYFLNDIQSQGNSTGTPIIVNGSKKDKIAEFLSDRSYFFDFLYWRINSKYRKVFLDLRTTDMACYQDQERLSQHKEELANFIKNLKNDNKKVIVIIFPFVYFIGPNYPAANIHNIMDNVFRENGVETIDLLADVKDKNGKDLIAGSFDSYPNELVHKLAAERLFKSVETLLK